MPKGSGRTKNLRYGAEETGWGKTDEAGAEKYMNDLFSDAKQLGVPVDDMEDVYEVDIDLITKDASTLAASNVQNLLRLYNNKQFTDEHPDFKRRIDTEIESLRKLYKMASVNEQVHDHLVTSISKNPGNASLYMALDRIQGKMLSVDKQIRDQISNFNKIITGYQMELNFAENDRSSDGDGTTTEREDGSIISRGRKAFIEEMKNKESQTQDPEQFDPDNLPEGWAVDEETSEVFDEETGECVGKVEDDKFIRY